MRAVSEGSWTKKKICELSGLSWRTVSRYLPGLVSERYLKYHYAKDNKTKIYRSTSPKDSSKSESVILRGAHEARQAERLQKLGFKPVLFQYPRGRRKPDTVIRLSFSYRIIRLWEKGGDPAISPLIKLGLNFKHEPGFMLSIRGSTRVNLLRALQMQESKYGLIQN
jgi:hypothetical protein